MKPFKIILPVTLFFLSILSACGAADYNAGNDVAEPAPYLEFTANGDSPAEEKTTDQTTPVTPAVSTRTATMLIRTADIRMKVEDNKETARSIRMIATALGGYISGENTSGDVNYQETSLTIRVPNTSFDSLVEGVCLLAAHLDHKSVTTQDVGEEYMDLNARLEARKAAEQTYLEILRSARKISDVLEVQERLRQVREEIESAQGRMRYLKDRVSYSTITVTFYTSHQVAAAASSGAGLGERLSVAFLKGWNGILSGLVGLAYAWPVLLLLTAFILMRKRVLTKRRTLKAVNE